MLPPSSECWNPQSMKVTRFILVSVLLLVLSFAGCGGEKTVTRGEWIAQAETICSRAAAAMDKLDPNAFKSQSEFVRSVNEAWDDYLEELHALATPPEDAAAIAEWLDLLTKLADAWKVFLVSDGGPKATQTFQRAAFPTQARACPTCLSERNAASYLSALVRLSEARR